MASEVISHGKEALIDVKGKAVNGFATGSVGGEITSMTITFEDGTWLDVKAEGRADWPDAVVVVEWRGLA